MVYFQKHRLFLCFFLGEHLSFPRFTLFIKNRRGDKHKVIFRIQWKRKNKDRIKISVFKVLQNLTQLISISQQEMHFLIISNIRQKSLYFCFYTFLITLVQEQSFKKREYELNYGIMKQVTKTIIIMSIQMSWSHGTIQMSWSHAAIQMTWTHGTIQMSQSLFNSTTLDYFQGYFDSRFQCVFIGITIVHCFLCLYYFSLTIPHVFYQIQYSFKSSTVEKKNLYSIIMMIGALSH